MYLKNLTLRGFKSFAGATTLALKPGITCVVGPNGSGKSNVVDALAWVMGEQGARALRGSQMADVIFAGTSGRAALGRAQVDLTIDNTDGLLDIEYSEVTISRTLFRGGGSEYSINGTPVRLLDVQELLSDTGMGRQMHVIVGQGQLDAILSSTPQERRGFIEEAAGVLKHRRRKERALKKLTDMDANLVRILDLTNEIHRQLGPLARAARMAKRASLIQARVRDAKARLLADTLASARSKLAAMEASDEEAASRRHRLQERIEHGRTELARLEEAERAASPAIEQASVDWQELTTLTERLRGTLMAASQKVSARATPERPRSGEDPQALEERARLAGREDADVAEQVEAAHSALTEATRAREAAEDADDSASRELARVNRVIADHREKVARLTGDASTASSRLEAAVAEAERAWGAYREAQERAKEADAAVPVASVDGAGGGSGVSDDAGASDGSGSTGESGFPSEGAGGAARAHARASAMRDAARARVDELLGVEREVRADRARWEARRDALSQLLTPEDGTAELLGREGVLGQVASLLRVAPGFEDAVAAALAPFADAVVVESLERGVGELAEARVAGRALRLVVAPTGEAAQCLGSRADIGAESPVSGSAELLGGDAAANPVAAPNPTDAADLPALPDEATWLLSVATCEGPTAALTPLLEGVVACGAQIAPDVLAIPGVRAVVTEGGDVLRSWSIEGGRQASSVLSVRADFEEASSQAKEAGARMAEVCAQLQLANDDLDRRIRAAGEALKALREEDAQRAKEAQELARAQSAAQAARAEAARAREVARRADEQIEWAREQDVAARARLAGADTVGSGESLEEAQAGADRASRDAREARERENEARLTLRTLEEQSRRAASRARSLRQAAAAEREERARYAQREAARKAELATASDVEAAARVALDAAERALARATAERDRLSERRLEVSREVSDARRALDGMSAELAEATNAAHRGQIAAEQTRLRVEDLERRSLEELSLEGDQLIAEFGPHTLVPMLPLDPDQVEAAAAAEPGPYVRAEQERALAQAQKELEKLGRVNPLALEEHEALAARHKFLVDQVQDLKKSKADLLRIVADVDRLVEEAFASAFAETREQFEHVFSVLFPGGHGDLVLTDPEDMLSTGIEIEARPAGKKVKRLSLLSGGERSLAAIAFLVAIFKARPSPFYVMDEVEAALDDVNLTRLLAIFKELQETSQLIIVTHQKRTMEVADALYGVTMRDGVTTVVSQRLGE
ncbi:chromosome segregation protein SMC [Schaalia meyeri]|uniref:chromosome segregation SMC family protein n=1 Tax=Schaalia meyeri TaxID=52773 RepID=UPI0006818855|nr:AAA family ATPase [Schaalia meyeri]AKU64774.1 chromosome segregation protein SMC [Schaalia meyeri]OFQ24484.1 chromosome segregation protein SMC [Actinomyces sp. HMSC062G12]